MPATVKAKYLGVAGIEKQIRERLERELKDYDGDWRVSVLGSAGSDEWEIKVVNGADGQVNGVKKLDINQTVDKIAAEAVHMVKTILRNIAA